MLRLGFERRQLDRSARARNLVVALECVAIGASGRGGSALSRALCNTALARNIDVYCG